MTEQSLPKLNRRNVVAGATAVATMTPFTLALARQSTTPISTPQASPAASPMATPPPPTPIPAPTPTPLPIPDHTINIVRGVATYGEPRVGGELALYIQREGVTDGNPATQSQDMTLLMSVFEGLVRINPQTMDAEPALATSWVWSEDGLTLTFTLRDDVAWHDGSAFSAADAAFTVLVYRDDYDSTLTGFFGLVADAQAVDARTLVLTFDAPDGAFVWNAANQPILQAAMYQPRWDALPLGERTISLREESPADWIGTGPWQVESVDDRGVRLSRFGDYWDGAAYADTLNLIVEDDLGNRIAGWVDGVVSALPLTPSQMAGIWEQEGNLFVGPGARTMFAAINFHNPANATSTMMVDMNLRRALDLAIDRDRYADQYFNGMIDEHAVGIMPQPWLRDYSLISPKRDVEAAKQTLADAGWYDIDGDGMLEDGYGNKTDLWLIVRENEPPELLQLLENLKQDWAEINVRLTVQLLAPEIFDDRWVTARDYDLIAYSLVTYPAFNEFDLIGSNWDIRSNMRGWNPGGYYNSGVDAAIEEWFGAVDRDAMIAAAQAIQVGIRDDMFGIWFGFPNDIVAVQKDVQGFNGNMFLYSIGSHTWWRGEGSPEVGPPMATPVDATPVASPQS
ncbi:MAG: ABC transporter substrate-binding protein [Thermomicrobiales bacterium]|nr:ABC transporter substrate-binding protein [Thermomicrobiales bacterium]